MDGNSCFEGNNFRWKMALPYNLVNINNEKRMIKLAARQNRTFLLLFFVQFANSGGDERKGLKRNNK